MGERKVLNKYIPPDFDPRLLPPRQWFPQVTVRIMLPCSVQCENCGEFIYKGKKFNAKKEEAPEHRYLTIKVWRFYFKCPQCVNEIMFRTDPAKADYVVEKGAKRNFEPWRQSEMLEEELLNQKIEEEKGDIMKVLENRTQESKREMDVLNALEEIYDINAREATIDVEKLIKCKEDERKSEREREEEELEREAREAFEEARRQAAEAAKQQQPEEEVLDDDLPKGPSLFSTLKAQTEGGATSAVSDVLASSSSSSSAAAAAAAAAPPPAAAPAAAATAGAAQKGLVTTIGGRPGLVIVKKKRKADGGADGDGGKKKKKKEEGGAAASSSSAAGDSASGQS